ncbi:MAG TPA: SCP2 sterol-binding domain-containing protein [Paracoccaceae bacterium]|nr:SCP2 sterol-binding domain-containing protein [Paracoccaceae bacterium]
MSETLTAAKAALEQKLGDQSLDGSVRFEIEGLGSVRIEGDSVEISDAEADCTLTADEDTFRDIMSGDLNPTGAFMSGRLKVDGDMSKAMALNAVLS